MRATSKAIEILHEYINQESESESQEDDVEIVDDTSDQLYSSELCSLPKTQAENLNLKVFESQNNHQVKSPLRPSKVIRSKEELVEPDSGVISSQEVIKPRCQSPPSNNDIELYNLLMNPMKLPHDLSKQKMQFYESPSPMKMNFSGITSAPVMGNKRLVMKRPMAYSPPTRYERTPKVGQFQCKVCGKNFKRSLAKLSRKNLYSESYFCKCVVE